MKKIPLQSFNSVSKDSQYIVLLTFDHKQHLMDGKNEIITKEHKSTAISQRFCSEL